MLKKEETVDGKGKLGKRETGYGKGETGEGKGRERKRRREGKDRETESRNYGREEKGNSQARRGIRYGEKKKKCEKETLR